MTTTIFKMEFGSHVYGTNLPTSDRDYKGIFLPDTRSILLGNGKQTLSTSTRPIDQLKNTAGDIDLELFSLRQFMKLLLEGQTVALTMLFAPSHNILQTSPIYNRICENRQQFLHKGVSAFAGYCRQQANKYGIKGSRVAAARLAMTVFDKLQETYGPATKLRDHWKLIKMVLDRNLDEMPEDQHIEFLTDSRIPDNPVRMLSVCNRKVQEHITVKEAHKIYKHLFDEYGQRALAAERQENIDWKSLMHAVRVAGEAQELLLTHAITYPRPDAALLLQIRKGELSYETVATLIEDGLASLEHAQAVSTLPEKPNYEWADAFIVDTYLQQLKTEID